MKTKIQSSKLIVLFLLILLGAVYYFVTLPQLTEIQKKKVQIDVDKKNLSDLQQMAEKMKNYDSIKAEIDKERLDLIKTLPPRIDDENIISNIEQLNLTKDRSNKYPSFKSITLGDKNGEDPAKKIDSSLYSVNVIIGYKLKYDGLKKMLDLMPKLKPKVVLTELSITKDGDIKNDPKDPFLNVQLKLVFYGYHDDGSIEEMGKVLNYSSFYKKLEQYIKESSPGTQLINPFFSTVSNNNMKVSASYGTGNQYDFFTIINPDKFDPPAVVIGSAGDGSKQVSQDDNAVANVEFVFAKNQKGQYFYKYKVGNRTYPANYAQMDVFRPTNFNSIQINMLSNITANSTDRVGANVSIVNNTDLPVNVMIQKDNPINRRLNVINKGTGDVTTTLK